MKKFTFTAWCSFGKGDSGETWIDVELTDEEAERLIKYGTQADIYYNDFCRCKELEDLYKKIYAIAVDQITEELRDIEDDAKDPNWKADDTYACGVNFPKEFENMLIEEKEIGTCEMEKLFGYDLINGNPIINEDEAKIVKFVFAKQKEYIETPPKELVDAVIVIAQEKGETLTYEEAKERVSYSAILAYIAREINSSAEFREIIKKNNSHQLTGQMKITDTTCESIISKETWDKVQEKLKR